MIAHLIRTEHRDTGAADFYCGEGVERPAKPAPDAVACMGCVAAALTTERHFVDDLAAQLADRADMSKVIGWVDGITLRLEYLEKRAEKAERRLAKMKAAQR